MGLVFSFGPSKGAASWDAVLFPYVRLNCFASRPLLFLVGMYSVLFSNSAQ